MECAVCHKKLANRKNLDRHHLRMHPYHNSEFGKFHYFCNLPRDMKFEIILFLSPSDLISFYFASRCAGNDWNLFSSRYNVFWEMQFRRCFHLPRKIKPASWGIAFLKMVNSCCFICWNKTGSRDHFFQIPLCDTCQGKHNSLTTISRTTAKKEYYLRDEELKGSEHLEMRNPHYGGNMTLYLLSDVKALADKKFGGGGWEGEKERRKAKKVKIETTRETNMRKREKYLTSALKEQGGEVTGR